MNGKQVQILIGTSGYSYPDWKGRWYPRNLPASEMLPYYARSFRIVELNFSYYRMPETSITASMVQKTDPDFLFSLKAHQVFTHERTYSEAEIHQFREGIAPLFEAARLCALLHQFPFSFGHSPANWDYLLRLKDAFLPFPQVVEFRHESWFQAELLDHLKREGIGLCCVDGPPLPGLPPPIAQTTSDTGYLRFHGRNTGNWFHHERGEQRYDYQYSDEELKEWLPKIRKMAEGAVRTLVFFNNHPRGQAPHNARMLMTLLGPDFLPPPGKEPRLF